MPGSFESLVAEAAATEVSGWDFSWLDGRATEQRPSWGYQGLLRQRLRQARAALDLQTGGGEVLAGIDDYPAVMVATEAWPPNVVRATRVLHPRGVAVVALPSGPPLPFAAEAFDLISSRHPTDVWWQEIARVLRPGGIYFAQHVGSRSNAELYEFFLGPQSDVECGDAELDGARAAGLDVLDVRDERLRLEFYDIGAVVYFLRKVVWTVPDFSVDKYHDRLRALHELIEAQGSFGCHSARRLITAAKPAADS
jgi:SAM-dependent methyltransferase